MNIECWRCFNKDLKEKYNYCPICGAKIEKKKEEISYDFIKEVSKEELDDLYNSYDERSNKYTPYGYYICEHHDGAYVMVDNSDGNAWTEEAKTKEIAYKWLNDEIDNDDLYELNRGNTECL